MSKPSAEERLERVEEALQTLVPVLHGIRAFTEDVASDANDRGLAIYEVDVEDAIRAIEALEESGE